MTANATTTRPTTCGALFVTDPEHGAEGCGRLPRHKGEHRATLTQRKVKRTSRTTSPKATKGTGRAATLRTVRATTRAARQAVGVHARTPERDEPTQGCAVDRRSG